MNSENVGFEKADAIDLKFYGMVALSLFVTAKTINYLTAGGL